VDLDHSSKLTSETPPPAGQAFPPSSSAALAIGVPAMVLLALLPLVTLGQDAVEVPRLALFLGRFHPTLVHLPIAFLLLALALDASRHPRLRRIAPAHPDGRLDGLVWLSALSAFAAACAGWSLAHEGGYDPVILRWHLWTGTATGIGAVATAVLRAFARERPDGPRLGRAASVSLAATCATLMVAGHAGGTLTHGEEYLTEHAPAPLRRLVGLPVRRDRAREPLLVVAERELFDGVVLRTLEDHCLECHDATRRKGELRLDSHEAILRGGESGAAIAPADQEKSELLRRVRLPLESDEHMPPLGEPQPDADEISVLAWWIERGAPERGTVAALEVPRDVRAAIERSLPERERRALLELQRRLAAEQDAVLAGLRGKIPGSLRPITPGERALEYTAAIAGRGFGDAELAELRAVGDQLVWMDLSRTDVTDAGLAPLAEMPRLRHLDLRDTGVGDPAVDALAGSRALETLSLYGTGLTDAGLIRLQSLPALRRVYVGGTSVTEAGMARLREARPELEVTP
jgi:uncharacterized membrane protein